MHSTLRQQQDAIGQLCREFGVVRLEVFGSSNRQDFDADTSDFDFIVDMGSYRQGIGRRFVAFADAMESLLGRRVDLVFEERMKPRFREAAAETREVIVASGDSTIAA
ncbi:MAG: nucleotidyltransferase domain-containing protein [Thermomicrobiales bacterium]|nr:nucleotidyltransferase domain-containing protein [Thermomicrobiales bacterium]